MSDWLDDNIPSEVLESTLFKFKVTMPGDRQLEIDLASSIEVDYEDLERQLAETPAQYIYWAAIMSEKRCDLTVIERKIKRLRASLTYDVHEQAQADKSKIPVEIIKAIVERDENLLKLEVSAAILKKQNDKLYHMVEALRMKSEHLRSLAGFKRQEMHNSKST